MRDKNKWSISNKSTSKNKADLSGKGTVKITKGIFNKTSKGTSPKPVSDKRSNKK